MRIYSLSGCGSPQAQDRIHRLGQFKPIHVTRFVIGGTIEERILKLQVQLLCNACTLLRNNSM